MNDDNYFPLLLLGIVAVVLILVFAPNSSGVEKTDDGRYILTQGDELVLYHYVKPHVYYHIKFDGKVVEVSAFLKFKKKINLSELDHGCQKATLAWPSTVEICKTSNGVIVKIPTLVYSVQ